MAEALGFLIELLLLPWEDGPRWRKSWKAWAIWLANLMLFLGTICAAIGLAIVLMR
ncbi:hypothetical protein DFR49_3803 [Hephaestia caeni]|uniref:Uncharacterized protein n=1 Tax=Hephaestia caeni TaxID=645617 RepID=A0A397NQE4_9SPHN|nr:hypothetical protein [Hephaestia caeni]RIA37913.1 hypothetical protein DFR49_3803 [Hephaestia caeni]